MLLEVLHYFSKELVIFYVVKVDVWATKDSNVLFPELGTLSFLLHQVYSLLVLKDAEHLRGVYALLATLAAQAARDVDKVNVGLRVKYQLNLLCVDVHLHEWLRDWVYKLEAPLSCQKLNPEVKVLEHLLGLRSSTVFKPFTQLLHKEHAHFCNLQVEWTVPLLYLDLLGRVSEGSFFILVDDD